MQEENEAKVPAEIESVPGSNRGSKVATTFETGLFAAGLSHDGEQDTGLAQESWDPDLAPPENEPDVELDIDRCDVEPKAVEHGVESDTQEHGL